MSGRRIAQQRGYRDVPNGDSSAGGGGNGVKTNGGQSRWSGEITGVLSGVSAGVTEADAV